MGWLLAVIPPGLLTAAAGFAAFRVFDIIKLPPASIVDRKLHTGFGVMLVTSSRRSGRGRLFGQLPV